MSCLVDTGVLCSLGNDCREVAGNLQRLSGEDMQAHFMRPDHDGRVVGRVEAELPPMKGSLSDFDCRNNRLAAAALDQIRHSINVAIAGYGKTRVGVVMGTSTSGIAASEQAVRVLAETGSYPPDYHAIQGTLGGLGEFVARYLGVGGPVYTLSTACSSSGNALIAARRLIRLGLCDAVVTGGVDSLCELTLQGFGSLEALSSSHSRPFTSNRDGVNIGEAAAVFLLDSAPGTIRFCGGACTSDAYHISAPHPEGRGALAAMRGALEDANLGPEAISYLNLHGTGTPHNDSMESKAVFQLYGDRIACSTTKPFTGHTLGAAAALELVFCWLLLSESNAVQLPPTVGLDTRDPNLAPLQLVAPGDGPKKALEYCMSNSFAFGGNNVSLIIGRTND